VSETERQEWDRRYTDGEYRPRTWPSPFLEQWIDHFPRGRALDLGCGAGRNSFRLAEAGHQVDAVDISASAISMARTEAEHRDLEVAWRVADLDDAELQTDAYDVITVIRYVNRNMWPRLISALTQNGWLLIEHHLQTTAAVDGPKSPDFRLEPQELLEAFRTLRVISYEEVLETPKRERKAYALARLVACKGDPGW
jgi:SAM-dependent methyltransferase